MSLETLDVGQANEVKLALRRTGWTNGELKKACEGDFFADSLKVLRGEAKIVLIEKAEPAAPVEVPVTEKFTLFADLGVITVPKNYVHAARLADFHKKHRRSFYAYDENITDANFPNPSRVLKPGEKLRVKAFKQTVSGETSSEERLKFLASQNAVLVGAQGASLVFEEKRNQLPRGYWYVSMDEKEHLYASGFHGVPGVDVYSNGRFNFDLGFFGVPWCDSYVLLCFCDESSGT